PREGVLYSGGSPRCATITAMRNAALVTVLVATSMGAQTNTAAPVPPANSALTDPAQITSKSKFDIQPFTVDKLYMTRSVGESAWSPDDKQIAFISNMSGRNNIWIVPAEGGWPMQLTVSNQRQATPVWSPKGRWIAYVSDNDGNEQWDLFLVSPTNGQVINLTNTPAISEEGPSWSPDGNSLAYSVKAKDAPNYEIQIIDWATRKVTPVTSDTPKQYSNINPIWSRDGKAILFTRLSATGKDSSVFLFDLAGKRSTNLTPHQDEHNFAATDLSPDGKTVLLSSDAGNGYTNAALLDVASKKIMWLTSEKWEVAAGKFSPDGKRVTWTTNIDGNARIFVHDLATRRGWALAVPEGINSLAGAETPFTHDGERLLYAHDGPDAPNDLWVYDFAAQKSRQITHSLVGGVRSEDMVEPFLVHYPSNDGKWQVSAFVYVPYNAERNNKNAAVVYIHGGPDYQSQNLFNRNIQYLV